MARRSNAVSESSVPRMSARIDLNVRAWACFLPWFCWRTQDNWEPGGACRSQ